MTQTDISRGNFDGGQPGELRVGDMVRVVQDVYDTWAIGERLIGLMNPNCSQDLKPPQTTLFGGVVLRASGSLQIDRGDGVPRVVEGAVTVAYRRNNCSLLQASMPDQILITRVLPQS